MQNSIFVWVVTQVIISKSSALLPSWDTLDFCSFQAGQFYHDQPQNAAGNIKDKIQNQGGAAVNIKLGNFSGACQQKDMAQHQKGGFPVQQHGKKQAEQHKKAKMPCLGQIQGHGWAKGIRDHMNLVDNLI